MHVLAFVLISLTSQVSTTLPMKRFSSVQTTGKFYENHQTDSHQQPCEDPEEEGTVSQKVNLDVDTII